MPNERVNWSRRTFYLAYLAVGITYDRGMNLNPLIPNPQ